MTLFHEKKSFSFLCPCGYGSLCEKEMFDHFLNSHGKTVDYRSPTFFPYWWSALPSFQSFQICSKCKLKTPLERFFENHKCVNFLMSKPIPTKLEWQTAIGRNQKPRRPFCRIDAADVDSLSEEMQEKCSLNAARRKTASLQEWFDSETGYVYTSANPNANAQILYPSHKPSPKPLLEFGTASAALRSFNSTNQVRGFPSYQPQISDFKEPDVKTIARFVIESPLSIVSDDYSSYMQLKRNDGIEMKMRGFLEGHLVDYSAIASTDEILSCGRYVVTDGHGQIVADVFVSPHFSSRFFSADTTVMGYNPAKLDIVGDMLNLTSQPATMTHHLALSNMLKVGEYRITRTSSNGTCTTMRFWLSNGRRKLNVH